MRVWIDVTQWYQYLFFLNMLSTWRNLKLSYSPASGEELLMPGAILLVPGCRSADLWSREVIIWRGNTMGFVHGLGIWQMFKLGLGLNIIFVISPSNGPMDFLGSNWGPKTRHGIGNSHFDACSTIGDLATTVGIYEAEILFSSLKDPATNSGFSLGFPHVKKWWLWEQISIH